MTAIVDYGAGNLTSVALAFSAIGADAEVTDDPVKIAAADRIVFPGVGAAASAMASLRSRGLEKAVRAAALSGRPFLGICLGMQILFEESEEDGGTATLGILPGRVRRFRSASGVRIPQMGWNAVNGGEEYYFVHGYYAPLSGFTVGTTRYAGVEFSSAVGRDNLLACQFHPEKSGRAGLALLRDWTAGKKVVFAGDRSSAPVTSARRVIPCLDVKGGRVTKGVKFKNNVDLGDPVEMAMAYSDGGADELVFYDITASAERRPIDIGMVKAVASSVRIPFAVGGGISSLADMERVILAGAEKVSVNSLAVRDPSIIAAGAKAFGSQAIVLGMDPVANDAMPSGFEITTRGFRERTGIDAVEWAKKAESLGAGEIVVNSVDADGTRAGFNLDVTAAIAGATSVPVVASGGAGRPEHFTELFCRTDADAAIVAGMIHTGEWKISDIKDAMRRGGIPVRTSF